VLLLEHL
jgi:hypothetical protein